jgi:hypothetical protein
MVNQIKTKLIIEVTLTDLEYKEVRQKYKFFWRAYNRERKLLLSAYINRHWSYFNSSNNKINRSSHPFQGSQSFAEQKTEQQSPSGKADGFKGRQLTPVEEDKVRYFMKGLAQLDYKMIEDMQDADSPSDIEYKESPNQ